MDYGAEPPEVNSGRMYAGVGSGPLMAAAAAWQALAVELGMSGAVYSQMIASLLGSWMGPSSAAMAASAAPYVAWMIQAALQCEEHAVATAATAASFETALAGVIPPPLIAENRTELATLVATNFLGVNTPAIAANQAEYAEFWAQDSSTLYSYAGEMSAILGGLMPFTPPMLNTDPAGLAAQAAAVGTDTGQSAGQAGQTVSGVGTTMPGAASPASSMLAAGPSMVGMIPQALQSLASPATSLMSGGGLSSLAGQFQSLMGPFMSMGAMGSFTNAFSSGLSSSLGSGLGSLGSLSSNANLGGGYVASMGRAVGVGAGPTKLSVPVSWGQTTGSPTSPLIRPLLAAETEAAPAAGAQAGMIPPGVGTMAGAGQQQGGTPGFTSLIPAGMRGSLGKEGDPNSRQPQFTNYLV
jgi:PPE-repeat protein